MNGAWVMLDVVVLLMVLVVVMIDGMAHKATSRPNSQKLPKEGNTCRSRPNSQKLPHGAITADHV